MKLNEFIKDFGERAEFFITKYEEFKELTGEQKKERVDEMTLSWSLRTIELLPINSVLKWLIKKVITMYVSDFTQVAFNLIKTRVKGITV